MRLASARATKLCLPITICGPFCSLLPTLMIAVRLPPAMASRTSGQVRSSMKTEGTWAYAGHARSSTPKNQDSILIGGPPLVQRLDIRQGPGVAHVVEDTILPSALDFRVAFPRGDLSAEYSLCWLDRKEVGMRGIFKLFCVSVAVALTLTTAAMAQWSIGQRGTREPPQGQNRYVYLVMSDPLPGREFDFND